MAVGSKKRVIFDNTPHTSLLRQMFGKRLFVEILEPQGYDLKGRPQVKVKILYVFSTALRYLIGTELYFPINKHVIWTNAGGEHMQEESPRIIKVHHWREDTTFTMY